MKSLRVWLVPVAAAWLPLASAVVGQDLELSRLVGSGDRLWPLPAAAIEVAADPVVSGEFVVFYAQALDGLGGAVDGWWLWDGQSYQLLVDSTMPIAGQFLPGAQYGVDESGLVGMYTDLVGVFAWQEGVITPIALVGDTPPHTPPGGPFLSFSRPTVRDGVVYFLGAVSGLPGNETARLYRWTETLGLEQLPFGPSRCCPSRPSPAEEPGDLWITLADTSVVPAVFGIYRLNGCGSWTELFRFDEPYPNGPPGSTWLANYEQIAAIPGGAVLGAVDSTGGRSGLYRITQEGVEKVLAHGDPEPVTGVPIFGVQRYYAASDDRIAFVTRVGVDQHGLTVQHPDRSFTGITATGQTLGGGTVGFLNVSPGGLSGDRLAFYAQTANDAAVWIADFGAPPEPPTNPLEVPTLGSGALVLLGLALAIAGGARLRRSQAALPR